MPRGQPFWLHLACVRPGSKPTTMPPDICQRHRPQLCRPATSAPPVKATGLASGRAVDAITLRDWDGREERPPSRSGADRCRLGVASGSAQMRQARPMHARPDGRTRSAWHHAPRHSSAPVQGGSPAAACGCRRTPWLRAWAMRWPDPRPPVIFRGPDALFTRTARHHVPGASGSPNRLLRRFPWSSVLG